MIIERYKTQTLLHDPVNGIEGNCTQAAIASWLGLELEEVPDFNTLYKDKPHSGWYWDALEKWFYERGYYFMMQPKDRAWPGLYLASGKSERGVGHFVLMEGGNMVHDPHPSRAGILSVDRTYLLMPVDPAFMQVIPNVTFVPDEEQYLDLDAPIE